MFSGSYDPTDVIFLLKPVRLAPTALAVKERLIQSGKRHYSEMIGEERLPSAPYLRVFHEALAREKARFAGHLLSLAKLIGDARPTRITLVSLARAGTPVGVLLTRILRGQGRAVTHYSVSIIRDRGIDSVALDYILARHADSSVIFVDGWTGKGVIARELHGAVEAYHREHGVQLDPRLYAVADLCGAAIAATDEDYLIPSSVLGCTISGLVSRSIVNAEVVGPGDFHGCVFYEEYREADLSRWFVEVIEAEFERARNPAQQEPRRSTDELRRRSRAFTAEIQERFRLRDVNHIKPGIGEATRVLLRRVPELLLLRDERPEVAHLLILAKEKRVPIAIEPTLPYAATALIKELD